MTTNTKATAMFAYYAAYYAARDAGQNEYDAALAGMAAARIAALTE